VGAALDARAQPNALDARTPRDVYVAPAEPLVDCEDWEEPPVMQKSCLQASDAGSNVGCVYWPTPTANSGLRVAFATNFGVIVHNPGVQDATVIIHRGAALAAQAVVPGGSLHTFELALDTGLKLSPDTHQSLQVSDAAYRLESTRPVAVYQFNPLDYRQGDPTSPDSYSYSNDASLVLPEHGMGTEYIVASRPTFYVEQGGGIANPTYASPGFFAVVATRPDTEVVIHFAGRTQFGSGVPAYVPGDTATFVLQAGEVLQVASALMAQCLGTEYTGDCGMAEDCTYCRVPAEYDLTGTRIRSSAPVAVFGGHNCTFIPFDTWACDHLEEQLLPVTAWGTEYVVSYTVPQNPANPEPNVIRILSAVDDNEIRFHPPQAHGASQVLHAGQWTELESGSDFIVQGDGPLLVVQHTVGENYAAPGLNQMPGELPTGRGDPAMGQVPPVGQFRRRYYVLAPDSIPDNYLNIVRPRGPSGSDVWLDGCRVLPHAFSPVGVDGSFEVARLPISSGPHRLMSDVPVGVIGYGFAPSTSYLCPAGLNLHTLCDVP
jgi:hypothetical protein